jgi:putative ABC transport system permease protein
MRRLIFFLRLLEWFSWRHLLTHPWRVLAVILGIALGAAVFTSVRLAVDASMDSFSRAFDLLSGQADSTVVRSGGRVQEDLVAKLWSHSAVETASPIISSYVTVSGRDEEPFLMVGLDPLLDYPLRSWRIASSSGDTSRIWLQVVTSPNTLLLSGRLARQLGLGPGQTVCLEHVNQTAQITVVGILEEQGLSLVEGGYVAIADLATMQEFTGLQGWVDRIDLRFKPGATREELEDLRTFLPPGVRLEAPAEMKESGQNMIHAYQLNLSMLSFVSLFVGMFLVYSLVSLNAASRRRELAILRSIGASSRMLFATVLCEGMILGLLGWVAAIPVGSFFVTYLIQGVSSTVNNLFVRVRVESLILNPWEILLSFSITVFVACVAAARPALLVTRIAPREAMAILDSAGGMTQSRYHWPLLGLAGIALSWPLAELPGLPGFPVAGYGSILFLVIGFSLLCTPVLRWIGSSFASVLRRIAGEPAFLAARYMREAGNRTAVSVGALVTATALFVALVIMVHSFRHTVSLWVYQTLAGDFFLRPKMAGLNLYQDPLPRKTVEGLLQIQGVEIMPYRHLELRHGKVPFEFEAVPFDSLLRHGQFLLLRGNLATIKPDLVSGKGVLVSEVFMNQTGLGLAERFQINLGTASLDLPILGVFRDYRTRGGIVYADLSRFQAITGDTAWNGARFFFHDPPKEMKQATDRIRAEVLRCCAREHPIEMISGLELRKEILEIFDQTFAVTTVLLLIALAVAGLGITTTLTVLVLDRIRQMNTLLAIGAAFGQIRSMIFWEAVLMVITGEAVGLVCGFLMAHLLIDVINLQSFGWTFLYVVSWKALLVSLPLILGTALVAALPAARLVLKSSPALVLKEH